MTKPVVPDDLWAVIEPLLPLEQPRPKGGRPPLPNRAALSGILFVLKSGIPWEMLLREMLPRAMGCGSGMTCWRRLRDWQALVSGTGCIASYSTAEAGRTPSTGAAPASTARRGRPSRAGWHAP